MELLDDAMAEASQRRDGAVDDRNDVFDIAAVIFVVSVWLAKSGTAANPFSSETFYKYIQIEWYFYSISDMYKYYMRNLFLFNQEDGTLS